MSKGLSFNTGNLSFDLKPDTSFRIILSYYLPTDQIITRIDIKIGNDQYSAGFISTNPIEPEDGSKILSKDDLRTPKAGIIDCINIKVPKDELLRALKELVSDIEENNL